MEEKGEIQKTLNQQEKKIELLKESEISLILDTYDDIFSDFDPRAYSQRALSDDFLLEAKKASRDKTSGIELKFLIPTKQRNLNSENLIKKRLREHFKNHRLSLLKEAKKVKNTGLIFAAIGILIMIAASYILFKYSETKFLTSFLITLLEPAGWFLFWEGLNLTIFESRRVNPDLTFYEKMTKCEISFTAY